MASESDDDPLRGEAYLATSREELLANAGSSYNQTMQLGWLADCIDRSGLQGPDLAIVGTPCVIQGAAAIERYEWDDEAQSIALTIALMCTRNFQYDRLRAFLEANHVDLNEIDRLDVQSGVVHAIDETGEIVFREDVEAFDPAVLDGCAECADFAGRAADISAGSVGSDDGYTTIVVRTERGKEAWEKGLDRLTTQELEETGELDRIAEWNARRARETLPREYDPEGKLSIKYERHREAYDDTDRAPQPLNPARAYQYEEWC